MNTNTLHKNCIRSPCNFFQKGKEDERTASFYTMAMAITTDLSMGTDGLMDDWNPTENANKDLSMHPPPLLERQRSSSPRSVSGFWPTGFFAKDSSNIMVGTGNIDANDNDPTDCLDVPPLPLKVSVSTDLMNLMHEYFNHDIVREILPKTTLTFYADREHKVDDFGIEEIDDDMKDAEAKMDSYFGERKMLEEFPLPSSNGEGDDPLNFLFSAKPQARAESTQPPMERHSHNGVPNIAHEKKSTAATKPSAKKKVTAKNKKTKKVPAKKFTTVKVVSRGKALATITTAKNKKATKVPAKKVAAAKEISRGKIIASITTKNKKATKVPTKKVARAKVVSRGKTIASIKEKMANTTTTEKKTNSHKSADKETATSYPMMAANKTLLKHHIGVDTYNPSTTIGRKLDPRKWEDHYQILKAFYDKNGHSNVLRSDPDQRLAGWVKRQRHYLKGGKLSLKQVQLLDDLDFIWNRIEQKWFEKFILLKEFAGDHGKTLNPAQKKQLAEWTQRQRRIYHKQDKRKMTAERIRKLESIPSWSWAICPWSWAISETP